MVYIWFSEISFPSACLRWTCVVSSRLASLLPPSSNSADVCLRTFVENSLLSACGSGGAANACALQLFSSSATAMAGPSLVRMPRTESQVTHAETKFGLRLVNDTQL